MFFQQPFGGGRFEFGDEGFAVGVQTVDGPVGYFRFDVRVGPALVLKLGNGRVGLVLEGTEIRSFEDWEIRSI